MNRFLLTAIALGLWANAAIMVIRPAHADTTATALQAIEVELSALNGYLSALTRNGGAISVYCTNCK